MHIAHGSLVDNFCSLDCSLFQNDDKTKTSSASEHDADKARSALNDWSGSKVHNLGVFNVFIMFYYFR